MNILIVDDNPTNLKLLWAQLEAEGHQVFAVPDGLEALAVLEREKVDAIISDILMPRMDGYRLCHEVRKNEQLQTIPFIFYTATYTSPSDEKLCFDLGGDKYLRKPSCEKDVLTALREATEAATRRLPNRTGSLSASDVMREYSERLVSKLEQKNIELERTLEKLHLAHEEILELNRNLERRVGERTLALEAANKELEAFSYSVSHDLRAPLRHIEGFIGMFKENYAAQLPGEACRKLALIQESAVHMSQIIDGLLKLATSGRQPLNKQRVSVVTLAREVLAAIPAGPEGRNARISIAELPDCLADPTLLRQVFANLVANALKYSRRRDPPVIEIGWRDEPVPGAYFVRDNGAGFDMRYAGKLFGAFQRLHASQEFEGIGVGLSIVQRIIQRHGGRIWAEAEVGKGATFYFALPG